MEEINMGIMDKLKEAKNMAGELAEKATEVAKTGMSQVNEKIEESKQNKLPQEGGLIRYEVTYKGGHPQYSLAKKDSPYIYMDVMPDRFSFLPKEQSKKWFAGFELYFEEINKIEIVERTISTAEAFLSNGNNNTDLRQKNVIEITYTSNDGSQYIVRNEMLTGFSVMGQAKVCLELMDLLRTNKILDKFKTKNETSVHNNDDILLQIEKLASLKEKGILTEDEFSSKKKELLEKL